MANKLWNKDFILMTQAKAVSTIGDLMYSVAIGYWVYEKTGSTGLMGIMSSISMFITLFFSPFCGSIVDKCNRKWVMVGTDLLQGVLMLTMGILAYTDALNVPIVLAAAVLAAFGSVLYSPAATTLLLDIIPRSEVMRGQSINSGIATAINLVGSAFSGMMVAFFGVPLIVVINGISNLYSGITELLIRVPKTLRQGAEVSVKTVLQDSRNAIRTIAVNPFLRLFIPLALILNLLGAGATSLALPFCLEKGFTVEFYGYVITVYMIAQLLAVILLSVVKLKPKTRLWCMGLGFVGSVTFLTIGYLSRQFSFLCTFLFMGGFCSCLGNTVFNASLMLALPEDNRSTILGFVDSGSIGGAALSALIYGLLGEFFPLYLVFAIGTSISILPMMVLSLHPRTKEFVLEHSE